MCHLDVGGLGPSAISDKINLVAMHTTKASWYLLQQFINRGVWDLVHGYLVVITNCRTLGLVVGIYWLFNVCFITSNVSSCTWYTKKYVDRNI